MARLVVNPGLPTAWEIQLQPGTNSIGRGFANDFKLTDISVSGSHCQILVENGRVILKDLGSTNGTFVNRAPVKEAVLQSGQMVHLGGVEMAFYSDTPGTAGIPSAPPSSPPPRPALAVSAPAPRAAAPISIARVAPAVPSARVAAPVAAAPMATAPAGLFTGSGPCKHHPKTPGRFFCSNCQLFFCEICVTSRAIGGVAHKNCRHCGAECVPVQVQIARAPGPKGFFARLPSAFIYPFRGSGLLVLIASTLVFTALEILKGGWLGWLVAVVAFGYLYSYMQNIIHATANEEEQMPELPGFDDVLGGAFRLGVTVLVCFTLPITFSVLKFFDLYDVPGSAQLATLFLGCLYFPMAFLAVAMKDSALSCNPLVVVPAIFKVPAGYFVTAFVVVGVLGIRLLGEGLSSAAKEVGFQTRDMSVLFLTFGIRTLWSLASVYLLTVSMRILGLLYVTNKHKFGWFDH